VWYEKSRRHVAKDRVEDVKISTIFLGLDFSHVSDSPLLWETMIFGGEFDQVQQRYHCYDDAVHGHAYWLEKVRGLHGV